MFTRNVVHPQLLFSLEPAPAVGMLKGPIEQTAYAIPKGTSGRAPVTTVVDDDAEVPIQFLYSVGGF